MNLDNLKWLLEKAGAERITVRIPEIPGYTTVREQAEAKELLEDLEVRNFDFFKYIVKNRLKYYVYDHRFELRDIKKRALEGYSNSFLKRVDREVIEKEFSERVQQLFYDTEL